MNKTYLDAEATDLLRLLERAAKASPDHTTAITQTALVDQWLHETDRFAPAALLNDTGSIAAADRLTALTTHGDYSPSLWRLARSQFEVRNHPARI